MLQYIVCLNISLHVDRAALQQLFGSTVIDNNLDNNHRLASCIEVDGDHLAGSLVFMQIAICSGKCIRDFQMPTHTHRYIPT